MNDELENGIVVVDTNVVSFFFKGDSRAAFYQTHVEGRLQIIAAQTRAELELWTLLRNWGERRRSELRLYLKDFVFAEADESICIHWAKVQDNAKRKGRPMSVADSWIAATAIAFQAPLITHNPKYFTDVPDLTVITEK